MKLKLSVLALAGTMAFSANAQESTRATRTAYEKSSSHNWFITFQGGASILGNGDNGNAKFGDRLSFTPSLAVGKWHSPYYATRLKLEAGEAKSFMGDSRHKSSFAGGHFDFMLDVVNFLSVAPGKCPVSLIPFVGLGYEYKFDSSMNFHDVHAATANAGLQVGVRLGERVDFVLEGQASWNGLQIKNSYPTEYANNLRYTASAGLNFRLGKVGFTPAKALDAALVERLNGEISALRAENAELSKRPKDCPDVVAPMVEAPVQVRSEVKSVLFGHGKHMVSKDQHITLFEAGQFVAKHGGELVVTGYMQKSETRFKQLAEKRAKEVARLLTEQYNVPSDKITIEYKDASEAAYDKASEAWNRVVIIRSK